jgi:hypothetical protein
MENIGYSVKTLDNKHSDAGLDNHCTANFSDTRRMMKSMSAKWDGVKFDHIILDYFFSPVSFHTFHCQSTFPSRSHISSLLMNAGWLGERAMDGSAVHQDLPHPGTVGVPSQGLQNLAAQSAVHRRVPL